MSVAWRPGNEFHLASSSMDGTLKMWDIRRSGQLTAFNQHAHSVVRRDEKEPPLKRLKTSSQIAAKAHDGPITSIVFTTDGGKLLSTGRRGSEFYHCHYFARIQFSVQLSKLDKLN
jgi:DNA excision repair protein ERCC-8